MVRKNDRKKLRKKKSLKQKIITINTPANFGIDEDIYAENKNDMGKFTSYVNLKECNNNAEYFDKALNIWKYVIVNPLHCPIGEIAIAADYDTVEYLSSPIATLWHNEDMSVKEEMANAVLIAKAPFLYHLLCAFVAKIGKKEIPQKDLNNTVVYIMSKYATHVIQRGALYKSSLAMTEPDFFAMRDEDIHDRTLSGGLKVKPPFSAMYLPDSQLQKMNLLTEDDMSERTDIKNILECMSIWAAYALNSIAENTDIEPITEEDDKYIIFANDPKCFSDNDIDIEESMPIDIGFVLKSKNAPEEAEANALLISRAPILYFFILEFLDAIDKGIEITVESRLYQLSIMLIDEIMEGKITEEYSDEDEEKIEED